MLRIKAYRFRLQPTAIQAAALHAWTSALRFLWNWMLAQRRDAFRGSEGRVRINYFDQSAQLPAMKAMLPWMAEVPSQALQHTLLDLDRAFANFFERRASYPSLKGGRALPPECAGPKRSRSTDGVSGCQSSDG